ncbi:MAG: transposase [Chloroflexota bacterium]|nr:transposase [Chloroflexota bacterium]
MNAPKCQPEDYIDFLVASPRVVSGTEAARVQPPQADPPAHDAFTRLLHRLEPDPATLWAEAAPQVRREAGALVLDDSTLDKPYARKMGLLTRHWSGKHRRVVQGINLLTLLWTDGEALIPCDYRLYDKANDGLSKNDHFRAMLATAHERGFTPECVVFDSWYASLENLKAIRGHGWRWVTQLKANRTVNPDGSGNRPLGACAIAEAGTRVRLQGYGFVLVFLIVAPDGDREYWATSDLGMGELTRLKYAEWAWGIEVYHRGLKQHCGVERAEVRAARAQRNHINCAIRAFLRLEQHRLVTGVGWWEAKTAIIREAIRLYLAHPRYTLSSTVEATA